MIDIGPHPTSDRFQPTKRYRDGTDANGRGKLKKLITRRKKQGRNVRNLERFLVQMKNQKTP